jgi:hypothetical protein
MGNVKRRRMPVDDFWIYYFTSSDEVNAMRLEHGNHNFEYEIIFESTDIDAVYWYEQKMIKLYVGDKLSLNKQYAKEGQLKFVTTDEGNKKAIATRIANGTMAASLKAASKSLMKTWEVTSPTGEVQIIVNLQQFCKDNGLDATTMGDVNKGRMLNHRGWTCKCLSTPPDEWQAEYDKNKKLIASRASTGEKTHSNVGIWKITKPDGEILIVENLRQFCRDNGLNNACMLDVSKGRHIAHKGWTCEIISKEQPVVFWEVTNPNGEVFATIDLKQFCIDNGLLLKTMKKIAKGYTINHRGGWTGKQL